jgi:hypothetical protein
VEREGVDSGFVTADTAVAPDATAQSQSRSAFDDQNPVNRHQDETQRAREPAPAPAPTGPSKARIEIKHIDLGLTPSEVVGTPDILQRFDSDGDGRVDLIEAARAGVAREGVFTFAGLAAANAKSAEQAAVDAQAAPQPQVAVAPDAAPVVIDADGKKLFTPAEAGAAPGKKFFNAVAAQGTPTGHVDAPKKFYGQGAEVVVGKFAADTAQKLSEKDIGDQKVVVTDDGETKLYDKVAQTDTDQTSGEDGADDADTSPRHRQAAQEDGAPVVKKGGRKGVAAYAPETTSTTTVVTA